MAVFSSTITSKLAVWAATLAARAARRSGRWGGTALPGKLALKLWPEATQTLASQLKLGNVLLSGTNGKTTTTHLLADCARKHGLASCTNAAGANLVSGVTTALLRLDQPQETAPELGLFEVDEAALPVVAEQVQPRLVVLLNLFRDQLDRHGELESLLARWRTLVSQLDPDTQLLVNADDPGLVGLTEGRQNVAYFGIADSSVDRGILPHAADTTRCRHCQTELAYSFCTLGHLGAWRCPSCHWQRPPLDFAADQLALTNSANPASATSFTLIESPAPPVQPPVTPNPATQPQTEPPQTALPLELPLPGLHNVYNCLAAAAAARLLSIPAPTIASAMQAAEPVFGRAEELQLGPKRLTILLAKNPTGANENIHTILQAKQPFSLLVALNDRVADGHDPSWIWDVDYDPLFAQANQLIFTGDRAHELALRYSYGREALDADGQTAPRVAVVTPLADALHQALELTLPGEWLIALPTYSATLELRSELTAIGAAQPFWQQS